MKDRGYRIYNRDRLFVKSMRLSHVGPKYDVRVNGNQGLEQNVGFEYLRVWEALQSVCDGLVHLALSWGDIGFVRLVESYLARYFDPREDAFCCGVRRIRCVRCFRW